MLVNYELIPMVSPPYRFTNDNIILEVQLLFAIEIGKDPLVGHHYMEFLMIDNRLDCQGVGGRPTLKEL